MIINMVGGGGGAALNFKVVPGLTQPETATENTIWVKTERIGAWYFSATQPEGLQEWDVWFPTGITSTVKFNALKKNAVQVYPLSAMQMMNGVLVDVIAKSYTNGKWVDWRIYLCNKGDQCTDVTGGWSKFSDVGQLTFTDAYIQWYQNTASEWGEFGILKSVDITNIKTLYIDAELSMGEKIFVSVSKTQGYVNPDYITDYVSFTANVREKKALDLSAYSQAGEVFFAFKIGNEFTTKFYNMYLE